MNRKIINCQEKCDRVQAMIGNYDVSAKIEIQIMLCVHWKSLAKIEIQLKSKWLKSRAFNIRDSIGQSGAQKLVAIIESWLKSRVLKSRVDCNDQRTVPQL